jgi:hypothetical protein
MSLITRAKDANKFMLESIKSHQLSTIIFIIALTIGIYTRIVMPQLAYTEFLGDQARDAFVHQEIFANGFVPYGPASSVGKYVLPGGYYNLVYLFSFWSNEPSLQVLSNSIASFLTIPLFGFLIYRAFGLSKKSILVASIASLAWAIFANDMFFGGFVWNPNSVNFFWMLLIVIYELILNQVITKKFLAPIWILQGIIFGLLVSLHSSSLFVVPIIFLINNLYISYRLKTYQSLWSILGFVLVNISYIQAELVSSFKNSSAIIDTVLIQAREPHTLVEKLNHFFDPVLSLANNVYFPLTNMPTVAFVAVLLTIVLGGIFYSGKRFFMYNYLGLLFVFLLASNSYWGGFLRHFLVLIWSVPLFFAFSLLFVKYDSKIKKVVGTSIIFLGFAFFTQQNLEGINNIYQNKFGRNRLVNVVDMKLVLAKLPPNSSICSSTLSKSLQYINLVNGNNLNFRIYEVCDSRATFEFVPRYLNVDFAPAIKNDRTIEANKIFYSSQAFDIVNLK